MSHRKGRSLSSESRRWLLRLSEDVGVVAVREILAEIPAALEQPQAAADARSKVILRCLQWRSVM